MKAKHFKKMRLRVTDKDWLLKEYRKYAEVQKELNHFRDFKCSTFFEGETLASLNRIEYRKRSNVNYRKLAQIKRLLENIGINL